LPPPDHHARLWIEIPALRQTSSTAVPSSAWRRMKANCFCIRLLTVKRCVAPAHRGFVLLDKEMLQDVVVRRKL
jgi:hypothetical protein